MNQRKTHRPMAALLVATFLASGAAMAQQSQPTIIEGVPSKPAPSPYATSEYTRGEIRQEARRANAIGEADKGGLVASTVGEQNDALGDPMARSLSRGEVQAQVRGETDRIGGEADDLGRMQAM